MKRIFPLLLVLLFSSCFDQNDCLTTATNLFKVNLATLGGVSRTSRFLTVQRDALQEQPNSTLRFTDYENLALTTMTLPLDPGQQQNSFTFLTSDSVEYHLTVGYATYTRVISPKCGAFLYYQDLTVLNTTFDSARIITPQLFKSVTSNIKLFY